MCRADILCDICLVSCRIVLDEVSQTENYQFCLESGQGSNSTESVIHMVGQRVNSFLQINRRFLDLATTLF